MNRQQRVVHVVALAVIVVCALAVSAVASSPGTAAVDQGSKQPLVERLDRMPLLFVPEPVSPDGAMGFAVRGREASVWLNEAGIAYRLQKGSGGESKEAAEAWVVALDLVGATPRTPVGEDPLPTKVSYFNGPREQWRTGLASYGSVRYSEPWPGVDVVVSGTAGELESTFLVRPGADPSAIRLAYRGATAVRLDPDGSLLVDTPVGEIREQAPIAYQEVDGQRVDVAAAFELEPAADLGRQTYRFQLGEYDRARELVVDPVTLIYCGYIGGSGMDAGLGIAVDPVGNVYIAGRTESTQAAFPVTVGPDPTDNGGDDAFVARVNDASTSLDYCGYIGGSGFDEGSGIAIDAAGNAYVTGRTESTEATFPVTVGPDLTHNGSGDAFVAKVNAAGTALDYCGYIGGSEGDGGGGIAVDEAGNAYVIGSTDSTEATFPVTVGPDLTLNGELGYPDAFVAKVNASGTALDYCGYIGGSEVELGSGIAVDGAGNAHVIGGTDSTEATFPVTVGPDLTDNGGRDAFVARVNAAGTSLDYCGYIGGSGLDQGAGIAIDAAGNAYITGRTDSTEATFPVTVGPDLTLNGADDAFVAKVNAAGTALDYCGYIGGAAEIYSEAPKGIAVDSAGNAYVVGYTKSTEATFPVTVGPDLTHNGSTDAFVARVNAAGTSLDYCGYIGGSSYDSGSGIAVDEAGNAYVAGRAESTEASFPVTVGLDLTYNGGSTDAFVAKVSPPDAANRRASFVPAAAVAAGAEGAFFQTDLEVNNKGSASATVTFRWLPRGQNNTEPLESEEITLAPGQSMRYENVLTELFGLEPDSVGALAMVADSADVIGMSRTYNVPFAKIAGTFGQGLPAVPADQLIPSAQVKRIIFMSENDDTRANVGCVNGLDTPVHITLELYDGEGALLEVRNMNLGPWSNNQINRIFGDHAPVNGYVDVSSQTEGAAFYCYGSVLDNLTSDPTTVLPQTTSGATLFIPAAALAAGLEGAFFQTDLDLNNAGGTAASYQLGWLPRGESNADPLMSDPFTLAAGASVRYENALADVFGLEPDQVGGLVVEADTEDLLAMSRTYNMPGAKVAGTFGQELAGVTAAKMIPYGVKKRIIFMNENDDVRSNVGCQNAGLEAATVKVELHDSTGAVLATKTMQLPPRSNDQITRVFRDYSPVSAGYVDVRT
jgi:hypothetical protein